MRCAARGQREPEARQAPLLPSVSGLCQFYGINMTQCIFTCMHACIVNCTHRAPTSTRHGRSSLSSHITSAWVGPCFTPNASGQHSTAQHKATHSTAHHVKTQTGRQKTIEAVMEEC